MLCSRCAGFKCVLLQLLLVAPGDSGRGTVSTEDHLSLADSSKEVKVLSLNVWAHMLGAGGKDATKRLATIAAGIKEKAYDVVLVQELFTLSGLVRKYTGNFDTFSEEMHVQGFEHQVGKTVTDPRVGQNAGLAIFSKIRLLFEEAYIFEKTSEKTNNKGFLVVKLDTNPPLALVNLHLDSKPQWKESQVKQVKEFVQKRMVPPYAIQAYAIAGDFNIDQQGKFENHDGQMYRKLAESFGELGLADEFGGLDVVTHPTDGVTYDHMFVPRYDTEACVIENKSAVVSFDREGVIVSDHSGIEVVFDLGKLLTITRSVNREMSQISSHE